jgi:hypothetical protein
MQDLHPLKATAAASPSPSNTLASKAASVLNVQSFMLLPLVVLILAAGQGLASAPSLLVGIGPWPYYSCGACARPSGGPAFNPSLRAKHVVGAPFTISMASRLVVLALFAWFQAKALRLMTAPMGGFFLLEGVTMEPNALGCSSN